MPQKKEFRLLLPKYDHQLRVSLLCTRTYGHMHTHDVVGRTQQEVPVTGERPRKNGWCESAPDV